MIGELGVSLQKSQTTGFALPTINKRFGSRYKEYQTERSRRSISMRSQFLQKVKGEVRNDQQYEYLQTNRISQEQKKLKNILREFNHEALTILNKFIDNPKPAKQAPQKERSVSEVTQLRDKQIQNKNKIIEQCQIEMKRMEERCENLKYLTHQQMQKEIVSTRKQLQAIKVANKQCIRAVTLNGLNICRGERFNQIKQIEYEKLIVDNKKMHLKQTQQEVGKQNQSIKARSQKLDGQLQKVENEFKQLAVKIAENGSAEKTIDLKEKKKMLETSKHRNQMANTANKHKYLHKLKQMDDRANNTKKHQAITLKVQESLEKTKQQLVLLEHKLASLKEGKSTVRLLQHPSKGSEQTK